MRYMVFAIKELTARASVSNTVATSDMWLFKLKLYSWYMK